MDRILEHKRNQYIDTLDKRMKASSTTMNNFCQAVLDVRANWLGYVATNPSQEELDATSATYAALIADMLEDNKDNFVTCLEFMALRTGITVSELLDSLKPQ